MDPVSDNKIVMETRRRETPGRDALSYWGRWDGYEGWKFPLSKPFGHILSKL